MGKQVLMWLVVGLLVLGFSLDLGAKPNKGKGDNRDDPHSGKVDCIGDGNSGQGDDIHRPSKKKRARCKAYRKKIRVEILEKCDTNGKLKGNELETFKKVRLKEWKENKGNKGVRDHGKGEGERWSRPG